MKIFRMKDLILVSMFLAALPLHPFTDLRADGWGRAATPEEKAFHRRIRELFAAAIPSDPPSGWETSGRTAMEPLDFVGNDNERQPMAVEYYVEWEDVVRREAARNAAAAKMVEAAEKDGPPVPEDRIKAYDSLAERIAAAAAAGDYAEMETMMQELNKMAEEMNRANAAMDDKMNRIARSEAAKDIAAAIYLMGNRLIQGIDPGSEFITVAGYPAVRTEGFHHPHHGWKEGSTTLFLGGNWFSSEDPPVYMLSGDPVSKSPFPKNQEAVHTRLSDICVRIQADPKRTAALIQQIDWRALERAIGR